MICMEWWLALVLSVTGGLFGATLGYGVKALVARRKRGV